jgi:hypothetical protein
MALLLALLLIQGGLFVPDCGAAGTLTSTDLQQG